LFGLRLGSTVARRIAAAFRFTFVPLGAGSLFFRSLCSQYAIGMVNGRIRLTVDVGASTGI
jgi:hypothetical protein